MNPLNSIIFALAIVSSVLIGAYSYSNRNRANDLISVTGLAKQDFESDLIVWSGRFSRRDGELRRAYELLKGDTEKVRGFVASKAIRQEETNFSSVTIEKEFEEQRDKDGNFSRKFKGYHLTQTVHVESSEIDKVETLSRDVTSIIDQGVEMYSDSPRYYYTKLGELKIAMIAAATQDGRMRAEMISENAGGKIGSLRFSSLGVFQITSPNSSAEYSWDGAFDTSSRKKSASVTIKLQFGIR